MFLFEGCLGTVLVTGDCRADQKLLSNPIFTDVHHIDRIYLDNTFLCPSYDFPARDKVLGDIVEFVNHTGDSKILIGMKKFGKEEALVAIAKALNERICVSPEKLKLYQHLGLPDVFTTNPDQSRIVVVNQFSLKKHLDESNMGQKTVGIILTALFYNWSGGPYSKTNDIKVFEYSDHSSYNELFNFVKFLRPVRVEPIVREVSPMMKERPDYLDNILDMSAFTHCLSTAELYVSEPERLIHDGYKQMQGLPPLSNRPRLMTKVRKTIPPLKFASSSESSLKPRSSQETLQTLSKKQCTSEINIENKLPRKRRYKSSNESVIKAVSRMRWISKQDFSSFSRNKILEILNCEMDLLEHMLKLKS